MRQFGYIILCFALCLTMHIAPTNAQDTQSTELRFHKHQPINWSKKLKLSDEQKEQLDAIYAESRPQMDALKQQIATLHQQIDNIRADDEKKIRAILDEKQAAKFDKIQERIQKQNRQPQPRTERRNRFKMREKQI